MATQVFTSLAGSKSAFDTISVSQINLEGTCGTKYCLNASNWCQLQNKVSEAYCKAVSAFEEAEKAYCAASGSSSSSDYCGDYCSSGYCFNDITVKGCIYLASTDGCSCIGLSYDTYTALYNKVYSGSSSSDYCGSSSSSGGDSTRDIIAYQMADSCHWACCPPPWKGGIAVGEAAQTYADNGISVGRCAQVGYYNACYSCVGNNSIAIGYYANSSSQNSIAIGTISRAQCTGGTSNISIGNYSYAFGAYSAAIGAGAYNQVSYSTSIFAGNGPDHCATDSYSVRFTQVARPTLDETLYIFQHIGNNVCSTGVKISATNFFNLLKSAGGEEYNVSPLEETYCGDYCYSNYCSSTYCTTDYCTSDNYC